MDLNNLFENFLRRCKTIKNFTKTQIGQRLGIIAIAVFVLLFFAPLFHEVVGAAIVACVGAIMTVLIWRRYDQGHAVVPAVLFCIPMVLDMLIYHTLSVASCMLVAAVCTLTVSIHPAFEFIVKVKDNLYAYLMAGGVSAAVVVLASLLTLLVSIAWWIFCLILFIAVIAMFFTVVLSTAAYTATDAKRQARKKHHQKHDIEYDKYDLDVFAKDIGIGYETDPVSDNKIKTKIKEEKKASDEQLFYDVD